MASKSSKESPVVVEERSLWLGGEKKMNTECILKTRPTGFADVVDMEQEEVRYGDVEDGS